MKKPSSRATSVCLAAIFITVPCRDASGPGGAGSRGLRLVSGMGTSDTIDAIQVAALVVEVRDSNRAIVPQGTVVRFASVAKNFVSEMWVQGLTTNGFSNFATGQT